MNRSILLWAAPLLLALSACPSKKTDKAQSTTAPAPVPADYRQPGYVQYRGQLTGAADSVTLHLTISPAVPGDAAVGGISGYYLGADGEPHELQQVSEVRPQPDSLVLAYYDRAVRDADGNEREIRWRLRRQPDGRLVGTAGGQAVQLRPVRPVLALAVRSFADSVAAFPTKTPSPYGHVGLQGLEPVGNSRVGQAVAANLRRLLRGDSLPNRPVPDLARLWQQQRADFSKYYQEDAAELAKDMAPDSTATAADSTEDYSPSLRYQSQSSASVICEQGDLLSLRILDYSYSGGAHGSFGSTVRSFDLRTGRVLAFNDIFRPEARTRLLPLLEKGVRRTLGIGDNERLDSQLMDNEIRLTTNVCLTPGGVLFMYGPYEIAAYALGEIPVYIPLAELRPLLREGLPLPGAGTGVAKR
ncbi:DUF3298 and DUF4163 domain-containing protein [Hymenobacter ruricola]|uniref:DUF3298 and DUF4163 domain-containing protein n=1 Tax=Hymenobacter ruricola TaxID=2791023 RepID=A0ABS0I1K2_9BACT|nr:DUF3298 and DUF4163 domain-containing protein [Hymenobacter ruricola]MBF9220454.1 DUF3298 and DUF4163 domain-containing protein [Hymenobacter ruricola]